MGNEAHSRLILPPSIQREREEGNESGYHIVWQPLPGSQVLALSCPAQDTLYHGTRGPGKTDAQLMKFRRYVGIGYGSYWRGIIYDKGYKPLDDIVSKSKRWFNAFGDGAKFHESLSAYKWTWPTGEELLFRQLKKPGDYWNYHGQEFPFIGGNEITKHATPEVVDLMTSCNRTSFIASEHPIYYPGDKQPHFLPELPLIQFYTANPYGPGHAWVKQRYVDPAPPGVIQRASVSVFNPRTQKREKVLRTRAHLFGSYKENRYLTPEYIATLESIIDPNKRKAWLWGDWDIIAGGALSDIWDARIHVKPRFKVPYSWKLDRSFDWGSSHPFSVGWWAEASGEEARLPDGTTFCPRKGSLIRLGEWYGTEAITTNRGLMLPCEEIADKIKVKEAKFLEDKWIASQVKPGPADNQIGEQREVNVKSIKTKMAQRGCQWTDSDKRPGSRKQGLELMRAMMIASKKGEGPGLYWMDNCRASIALLPNLPRDEDDLDDVNTTAEDHIYDETRYRVLAVRRETIINPLSLHGRK